jgi:hypothetical protein
MPQLQGGSSPKGGRLDGSLQKTALAASNFALGVGWGATGSLSLTAGSTDQRGSFAITAAGAGLAQATATIVLTFADGAYASAPFCLVTTTNTNSIDTGHVTWSATTTALTLTFSLLPVAAAVYTFTYALIA